jgi:predicted ATP-binding protein involved in virulence
MIRPEDFPYITSLHVNDCYTYQDFDIPLHDYQPFSHLILTGKNGSGKSTILRFLNNYFVAWRLETIGNFVFGPASTISEHITNLKQFIQRHTSTEGAKHSFVIEYQQELERFSRLTPNHTNQSDEFWKKNKDLAVYSYFPAKRNSTVDNVSVPSSEIEFIEKLSSFDSTQFFISKFKQYLVNQKVEQAFGQLESEQDKITRISEFFKKLEDTFREVFDDKNLMIEFSRKNYEFYIILSDGRKLTFDTLSEGFSAFLSILMDLFTRVNLIRKQVDDFAYHPCGIVLIDEPETHLHLQLQEQILPLLTNLFPNIQFIVATHSPAVIASIKQATIFDLTTKESIADEVVGRSYSDLMVTHFGLDNDYSDLADAIIKQVNEAVNQYGADPVQLQSALQKIYKEQSHYLSPTLRVELELMMAQLEAKHALHS